MDQHYWGFTSPPFSNRLSERTFYESPVHEEALARLLYCIEQDKALAVLYGPAGCGKSQLLEILAGHVRRSQRFCAVADLLGLSDDQFLRQLEIQLRLGGTETDSLGIRWRRVCDFLETTADSGLQTVLLFDNLEAAGNSTVTAIRRLIHRHEQSSANVAIVAALDSTKRSPAVGELLELADLCIEVGPLGRVETESYVQTRLQASGNKKAEFEPGAIDQLQRLTDGVPREINRLCELALLAGMSEDQTVLTRRLIAGLTQEYRNRPSTADC